MKYRPRRHLVYILFRIGWAIIYLVPIRLGTRLGASLGSLTYYLLARERKKALVHLKTAFPDRDVRQIAREVFRNLGKTTVEIMNLPKLSARNIDRLIEMEGAHHLDWARAQGSGCILIASHFGNWELMAAYLQLKGYRGVAVARRLRDERFDRLLNRLRQGFGLEVIIRDDSPKKMLRALKENRVLGIFPDQDVDSVGGVFVDFLGAPAYTPTGPVALALASGAAMVPVFLLRLNGKHRLIVEEPLSLEVTGNKERDLLVNTKKWSGVVESYIRRYPEQWVWMHRRWKTKMANSKWQMAIIMLISLHFWSGRVIFCEDQKESVVEQKVQDFSLSSYQENGEKKWDISGDSATVGPDNKVEIQNIDANAYGKDNAVNFKAQLGTFDKTENVLHLENNVVARTADGAVLKTDRVMWDQASEQVLTDSEVTLQKDDATVTGKGVLADRNMEQLRLNERVILTNEPIKISCDGPMEADYKKDMATFYNNVLVQDPRGEVACDKMEIYYDRSTRKVTKIIALGNVRVTKDGNTSVSQKAIYDVLDGKIILSERPEITLMTDEAGAFTMNKSGNRVEIKSDQ